MAVDVFAGIAVTDYERAVAWYEKLLGAEPRFLPNEVEAVWGVAEHGWLVVEVRPGHAGHAKHTIFVDDLDARVRSATERGIEPTGQETYANGVRKVTFRDPDGNQIGFGGAPTTAGTAPSTAEGAGGSTS